MPFIFQAVTAAIREHRIVNSQVDGDNNNGLGIAIVSTPKGVMADHAARDANVGGEILLTVF